MQGAFDDCYPFGEADKLNDRGFVGRPSGYGVASARAKSAR